MAESERTLPELNDEDIMSIANVVTKIAVELREIKKTYRNPKEYTKKIQKLLKYKKNLSATFIIYDINNLDHRILYSPAEFKDRITKSMQSDIHYDNSDMVAMIGDEFKVNNDYITPNNISKALKALEKEIGLNNTKDKENIKKIKGKQKIEFLGRPSRYHLPSQFESLKRVMSKPKAIEYIFKSLKNMGYLSHLTFVCEATFYAIMDQNSEETAYHLVKGASMQVDKPDAKVDKSSWEWYRDKLLSMSDDQLKILAGKVAEDATKNPALSQFILLLALSKSS